MTNWKPVVGYEGLYLVSDTGIVMSTKTQRPLFFHINRAGYPVVVLHKDRARKGRHVHQLVAEAFIGPRLPGMQTRHLDGNPANNHRTNLAYGTLADNMQDALRHGVNPWSRRTQCKHGHEYTDENTAWYGNVRRCRACGRIRAAKYQAQRKAARRAEANA